MLFSLSPERAHELTLSLLKSAHKIGLARQHIAPKPVTCMGIEFPNPVGLAAGLDKNGAYIFNNLIGQKQHKKHVFLSQT